MLFIALMIAFLLAVALASLAPVLPIFFKRSLIYLRLNIVALK
jgi:hypothetical protein